jgi:hypothetical protein
MWYCLLFFISFSSYALNGYKFLDSEFRPIPDQTRAMRTAFDAVDSYPKVKQLKKEYEKKALKKMGVNKKDITPYLTVVAIGYQRRITTGYLRKLSFEYEGWRIKPEAQYYFDDEFTIIMIHFGKEW